MLLHFYLILKIVLLHLMAEYIQSNSVMTNSMGPRISVRYNREFVITDNIYVMKETFGTENVYIICSLLYWSRQNCNFITEFDYI